MKTLEKITNAERLAALKALPLPVGAQFSIKDVTNVNHKPHPYTVGSKHMEEAQKHGGILGEAVIQKVPCAAPRCGLSYEQHTSDTVCLVEVSASGELKDVPHLNDFLLSIKDRANELGVDGFAFVQAPKPYAPKDDERIALVDPQPSGEPSKLTKNQKRKFGPKPIEGYGEGAKIWAKVSYDDDCGHNTFSITGTIRGGGANAGGCLHDEIALAFPELAPFIKWHLCSSDGPMHYVANTAYAASSRDYRGLLKGEKRQLVNGKTKLPVWERIVRNSEGEVVKRRDWVDSEEKPSETLTVSFEPVWITGEGKERNLDHARSSAIWPDATDEDLTAPGLKERLEARLPALLAEFRAAVESLGFTW